MGVKDWAKAAAPRPCSGMAAEAPATSGYRVRIPPMAPLLSLLALFFLITARYGAALNLWGDEVT